MSDPIQPPPPSTGSYPVKSQATVILTLGIISIVCCGLLGPVAWYMGNQEVKGVREGRIDPANEGLAKAGMILGIVASVFLIFGLLWVLFFGGLGILGSLMGSVH